MSKSYQEYCKEAYDRDPITYGASFNKDGSKKKFYIKDLILAPIKMEPTHEDLMQIEKELPDIEVTGTQILEKGEKLIASIVGYPPKCSRKEYKRIWINNKRVIDRIKTLEKKHGVKIKL